VLGPKISISFSPYLSWILADHEIVRSFMKQGDNGLDKVIPRHVLQKAVGFAIFTVVKAGFVFSARAGSGVVIAKLDDGSES